MKCPKCGFDQPDDRFCANCGVDVNLFVPRTNFFGSFFRSSLFYIVFTTFVVGIGVFFLIRQKKSSEYLVTNGSPPNSVFRKSGGDAAVAKNEFAEESAEDPVVAEGGSASLPNRKSESPQALPVTATAATEAPSAPTPPPPKTRATTFRVSFLEVDPEFESTLFGSSSNGALTIRAARENIEGQNFAARMKLGRERNSVSHVGGDLGTTSQNISTDEQNPNAFSFVSFDARINGEVGLVFQLKATQVNEKGTNVLIEGRRIIGREDLPQADVLNFQQEITIPLNAPIYITGLVRGRNAVDQNELTTLSNNPVFSIFRSDKFRAGQSSFVLLIEAVERP